MYLELKDQLMVVIKDQYYNIFNFDCFYLREVKMVELQEKEEGEAVGEGGITNEDMVVGEGIAVSSSLPGYYILNS